jgi:hypothetical protein
MWGRFRVFPVPDLKSYNGLYLNSCEKRCMSSARSLDHSIYDLNTRLKSNIYGRDRLGSTSTGTALLGDWPHWAHASWAVHEARGCDDGFRFAREIDKTCVGIILSPSADVRFIVQERSERTTPYRARPRYRSSIFQHNVPTRDRHT